jgi:hypothetical protein
MTRYHDFTLIDLYSQRQAVNRYVRGWSRDEILAWLNQHGTVTEHWSHPAITYKQYVFEPFACRGLAVVFNFDGDPSISDKHPIVVIRPDTNE